jgi:large subunit ribosomal protein L18
MVDKRKSRQRRAGKSRARIALKGLHRLSVHRTPRHIYAQVISPDSRSVIAAASTVQKQLRDGMKSTGNTEAAAAVGKAIAEKAIEKGVSRVAFDRSGFRYHGRIKALAEAAREAGLEI